MIKKYNIKKRREVLKLSASFLIAFFVFSSCKKEITTVGTDINPNELNIVVQDTFSVITKTVITDSLPTDETTTNLLGGLTDPELGKVDCGIVTQLRLSSESPNFGNIADITVDSVVLSFVYDSRLHYGELQPLTFEVFEIGTQLDKEEEYYRNTPVTTVGSNLIVPGMETILPEPNTNVIVADDTLAPMLRIHLKTSLGEYFINNVSQLNSNDNFTTFFKGLYVKLASSNTFQENEGTVLYFSLLNALSNMVLYYTIGGENKKFTFNINSNSARFNKMDFDFTSTPLESSINSEASAQEKIYFQASHIRPEFHFPFLDQFGDNRNIVINKAELIVPVQDFESSPFDPSNALFIGRVSSNFLSGLTFDYSAGSTINYDFTDNIFRFNLTRDLQRVVSGEIENTGYRVFSTNFFGSSIERIIFSGPKSIAKDKTKLIITYTEY